MVLKTDQAVPAGQGFRRCRDDDGPMMTMSLPGQTEQGHQHQKKSLFLNIRFPTAQPT